ncbi:N-acetyltransferase family protein [Sphingobacterium sp. LRF_L2]|uniref:GNAT family N-acetyltransferase n=1 Tax=Sphingobacterium sp. LRF_L2 TaxID=3369421 RepID=UPI003F5F2AF8
MRYTLRHAEQLEIPQIWDVLSYAISKRKEEGSTQWQDGYPNPTVVAQDIENKVGFVLVDGEEIAGYCALIFNDEPAYEEINGKWLTDGDFLVFHRVAFGKEYVGKGLSKILLQLIEQFAIDNGIVSVRADTNFDNQAMLKIFEKSGYSYCGEVYFRGSSRQAFEKVL